MRTLLILAFGMFAAGVWGCNQALPTAMPPKDANEEIKMAMWAKTEPATEPANDPDEKYRPNLSLGKKLDVQLGSHAPVTAETATKIKSCIDALTDVESPDFGFSPTLTGSAFLPIPEQTQMQMGVITDHKLRSAAALKALVEWGPDALPYLLSALDDKRETKLKIVHNFVMGGMWFSNELQGNPVNTGEAKALDGLNRYEGKGMNAYTVLVGDICFVAIGEIVGRQYSAVRYQPTACIVINSPVEDPDLCRRVREIWSSNDARKKLWDSLLTDYATQAAFNGESLDGWDFGSQLQISAAMRLLYYFPKEAGPVISERLHKLDVGKAKDLDDYMKRCVANGVRAKDFLAAVCRSPDVRETVAGVFSRTDDYEIMLEGMPAVDDKQLIRGRIDHFLKEAPADDQGAYEGYKLLRAAQMRLAEQSEPLFALFLKDGNPQREYSASHALMEADTKWSDAILIKLLDDMRPVEGYMHWVSPNDDKNRLVTRVCDSAAEVLSINHKELKFNITGTTEALDDQIATMKKELAKLP